MFSYSSDYLAFLRYLGFALRSSDCSLHAATLMPNHVHLIITPPNDTLLSIAVARFSQRYAQYRNRSREASGKLFEQRFLSIPILDDRQLAITTAYVDLNPLRGGLVRDPTDYAWSTYAIHAGEPARSRIPSDLWTPSAWYQTLGSSREERATRYREVSSGYLREGTQPNRAMEVAAVEALSFDDYRRRVERPDGTAAT